MTICPAENCTGCAVCANACPIRCISLCEDAWGELHPVVDEKVCVQCHACVRACPNKGSPVFREPQACFAAWNTDASQRARCVSGGLGTLLAEYFIRFKHGVVFGTAYDASMTPRTISTETLTGIDSFKGSKYVQSVVSCDTFQNVEKALEDGRWVLYIGTPCQVAGLKSFLSRDHQKLLTVDLICHGVCPSKYFEEEILHLCRRYHINTLADIRFRGNDGNNYRLTLWESDAEGKLRLSYRGGTFDYYLKAFLMGVTLRGNCYRCPYARPERVSDITIGDFIGLGTRIPFPLRVDNVSSVTLNTAMGIELFADLSDKNPTLISVQREYQERLDYRPSLIEPFSRHSLFGIFRRRYLRSGYSKAIRRTLFLPLLKAWFLQNVRLVFACRGRLIHKSIRSLWDLGRS